MARSILSPSSATANGFTGTARVGEQSCDQMRDEPDIVVTHVLVDIDQDEDAGKN